MKAKKNFLLNSIIALLFTAVTLSIPSLAWYIGRNSVDTTKNLGGSVLQSYFNSGDGSAEHPFTITTPWHYENFVKLHYNVNGFAAKGHNFAFGDTILGSTDPVFYKTDIYGVVDRTQTSTTLNLGGMELMPLGTEEKPFIATLNGNGLTITNFKVNGNGYNDIGIFGFVTSIVPEGSTETKKASISNCYWDNFTIITTGGSKSAHKHSSSSSAHDDRVEVGYLAGHVVDSNSFTNCYVNNCTIDGTCDPSNDTYGYYGKAEKDVMGAQTGSGVNYSYTLDSAAIYNSINNNYNNYKNYPIRARNKDEKGKAKQYTEYTTPIGGESEIVNNTVKYPVSEALIKEDDYTYNLNGKRTGNKNYPRNYSFSTLGYQPLKSDSDIVEYEGYYTYNGETKQLPENTVVKTEWNGQTLNPRQKDSKDTLNQPGDFIYYYGTGTDSEWKYIHSENTADAYTAARNFKINLTYSSSFQISGLFFPAASSVKSAKMYLYIDGKQYATESLSGVKMSHSRLGGYYNVTGVSLKKTLYENVSLKRGTHYYAFFFLFRGSTERGKYYWLNDSKNTINCEDGGTCYVEQGTFDVTQSLYNTEASKRIIDFSATTVGNRESTSDNAITPVVDTTSHKDSDIPTYVNPNTFQVSVTGVNIKSGVSTNLTDSSIKWELKSGEITKYDEEGNPYTEHWYKWIGSYKPSLVVDPDESKNYFLANDPDIRSTETTSGYEYENIDIVGGGVKFYYREFTFFDPLKILVLPHENDENYVTKKLTNTQISNKVQFYSTQFCPGSVVMYLKNTHNAADSVDQTLGHVEFTYVNGKIFGISYINLETPAFKKGNGLFVDIDGFGTQTGGGGIFDMLTTFTCDITEAGAKQCSYCALDSKGKVIGVFDENGNPSTGFLKSDGSVDNNKLLSIDTYVLALGTYSDYDLDSWVTKVEFDYTAKKGFGGTWGTVGYRSAPDTLEGTILNFYYDIEQAGVKFSIKVEYANSVYTITCSCSTTISVNVFNYDTTNYTVIFNGETMLGADQTFVVTAT